MLAISRREIQQLVAVNDKLIKKHPGRDSIETIQAKTVNTILHRLFGSKCLPDENPLFSKSPENYNNENLIVDSENKPAEPKGHIAENHNLSQYCDKLSDNPQSDKNKARTNHFGDSNEMVNDSEVSLTQVPPDSSLI